MYMCVRDKTKFEAKKKYIEWRRAVMQKMLFKYERKKNFYAVCYGEVQFMRQSPRFMQICAMSTINVTSRAKSKTFPFAHPPTTCIFSLKTHPCNQIHLLTSLLSDDLLQHLIGFIITFFLVTPISLDSDLTTTTTTQLRLFNFIFLYLSNENPLERESERVKPKLIHSQR